MQHREFVRIIPEADTAVLFLHGIVGSPRHFDSRLPLVDLVPENWSVYSVLLPGHGGSVEDFSASGMQQWKAYVWGVFDQLSKTHRRVILVGHSMGTLFAIQLAIEKGNLVPFIFLIAAPICPRVSVAAVTHSVGLVFPHPYRNQKINHAMSQSGSVSLSKKVWKYLPWIPHMLDLLKEAENTKKLLPCLKTKAFAFQSEHDELVSRRSEKYLKQCPCLQLEILTNSTHFYYTGPEIRYVREAFSKACKELDL